MINDLIKKSSEKAAKANYFPYHIEIQKFMQTATWNDMKFQRSKIVLKDSTVGSLLCLFVDFFAASL